MARKSTHNADKDLDAVTEEQASADEATDAVFTEDEFVAVEANAPPGSSWLPIVLGCTALLIAVIALAGFFYLAFSTGDAENDTAAADEYLTTLAESVRKTDASLRSLQDTLTDLADKNEMPDTEIAAMEQRLDTRLRTMESVPDRVLRLERSFAALQGISTGVQDTWLLAETEYYLQIANAQAQLAGNPHLAALALKLADERLQQLADPALTKVRRVIANELQALEIIENPDIEGAILTLASLASVLESLPLRQQVQKGPRNAVAPDEDLTGVDRALASLKGAVGNVVTIRRTGESIRPLIAPEAVYFLRANLALQLQAARLALLRGEQAVFRQSLDDAGAWIEDYYDTQSNAVRTVLQTLRQVRDNSFVSAIPDISESLRLLRQHRAFSEAVDTLDAETDVEPQE